MKYQPNFLRFTLLLENSKLKMLSEKSALYYAFLSHSAYNISSIFLPHIRANVWLCELKASHCGNMICLLYENIHT